MLIGDIEEYEKLDEKIASNLDSDEIQTVSGKRHMEDKSLSLI